MKREKKVAGVWFLYYLENTINWGFGGAKADSLGCVRRSQEVGDVVCVQ